jgi:hypothetical protein
MSTNKTTIRKIIIALTIITSVIFSSCQPATIEVQVEKLMKTDNMQRREKISCVLADQLNPKVQVEKLMKTDNKQRREKIAYLLADLLNPEAVELILGLSDNDIASHALCCMFVRYRQIIVDKPNKKIKAYECINYIPLQDAVEYLGQQSLHSKVAFKMIKTKPYELKEMALLAGLRASCGDETMVDSLICETKNLYGDEAMVKLLMLCQKNKPSEGLQKAVFSYGNAAVDYLINDIERRYAQELLARLGKPALQQLYKEMKSPDENK